MLMLNRFNGMGALAATGGGGGGGGGIQFVGYAYATETDGSDLTIDLTSLAGGIASAAAEGDVVLVSACVNYAGVTDSDQTMTTSGYTEIAELFANDSQAASIAVYWKAMGATPDTSAVVAGMVGIRPHVSVARVYRGVDTTTPMDVTATTATGTNSMLANPPSITPTTAGAWVAAFACGANYGSIETYSSSDLSNFVSQGAMYSTAQAVANGSGDFAWTSGAFDPAAFTIGGSDSGFYSWAAVTVALRPA